MPVPIIIWIAIGAVSLLVGGSVALNWDAILVTLKGKRIAVLGARGVGKTHLIEFLATGSIPKDYKQTVAPKKSAKRRFQLKELDLKIKETRDVSGDNAAYSEWKDLHDQADVVFYLLRADRLIAGDTNVETRVRDDLKHIGSWQQARKPQPLFFIVGTHCDHDKEFSKLTPKTKGDYVDRFYKLPIVKESVARGGGGGQAKVVLGSMKTIEDTEAIVYQIFSQVVS